MKYLKLGNSGLDVYRICLGMLSFGASGWETDLYRGQIVQIAKLVTPYQPHQIVEVNVYLQF